MTNNLFTFLMVLFAIITLIALVLLMRYDRDSLRASHDAKLGRDLRDAAGSEEYALFAIDQARTDRKYLGKRIEPKRPPPQLHIVRGGQPLDFPPDGAA